MVIIFSDNQESTTVSIESSRFIIEDDKIYLFIQDENTEFTISIDNIFYVYPNGIDHFDFNDNNSITVEQFKEQVNFKLNNNGISRI